MKSIAFLLILLVSANATASASCKDLQRELVAMQKAQQQIVASLVSNHEAFASTLEEYSVEAKSAHGAGAQLVSGEMGETAQAFRNRGLQGKRMALKLDKATADLFARVAACLK